MNVTKSEQKQIDRASIHGGCELMKTLAIIHRAGSKRTKAAIEGFIDGTNCLHHFKWINGTLLHISEA